MGRGWVRWVFFEGNIRMGFVVGKTGHRGCGRVQGKANYFGWIGQVFADYICYWGI